VPAKLSAVSKSAATPSRDVLDPWIERVTSYFGESYGLPPITGRILAWLMICDPPEQSGAQIAEATGASRASISTNVRLLVETGLVQRSTRPGERTTYYRMHDNAWETVVRRRLESMATFRELAREGIELLGPGSPCAARLTTTSEFFDRVADALASVPSPSQGARR
jgi:DNA-binding MarR family transcriptional regulator